MTRFWLLTGLLLGSNAVGAVPNETGLGADSLVQTRVVTLAGLGFGSESITTEAHGFMASALMAMASNKPCDPITGDGAPSLWKAAGGTKLRSCTVTDPGDGSNGIVVQATFDDTLAARSFYNGSFVSIDLHSTITALSAALLFLATDTDAQAHVAEGTELRGLERILIRVPAGMVISRPFTPTREELGPLRFESQFEQLSPREYQIAVSASVSTSGLSVESAERFYDSVSSDLAPRLRTRQVFNSEAELLWDHGQYREALKALDRCPAPDDHPALVHIRRSSLLTAAGLVEPARAEARIAVELEPNLPLAHFRLGMALWSGTFGQFKEPGCLLDEAASELRRVRELAPDERQLWAELPMMLRLSTCTRMYGSKARLAEAAKLFEELEGMDGDKPYRIARANTLVRLGRYADAERVARISDDPELNPVLYAAIEMQRGIDAVRDEAIAREPADLKSRSADVGGAAVTLMLSAQFQPAARLYRLAATWSPEHAEQWLAMAQVLDTVIPGAYVGDASRDAIGLFADIQRVLVLDSPSRDQLRTLLAAKTLDDEKEPARLRQRFSSLKFTIQDPSQEALVDLLMGILDIEASGSDDSGYVIRYRIKLPSAPNPSRLFVVREKGRYVLRASEAFLEEALEEIDEQLARGQLALPRHWLAAFHERAERDNIDPAERDFLRCTTPPKNASRRELLLSLAAEYAAIGRIGDADRVLAAASKLESAGEEYACDQEISLWSAGYRGDLERVARESRRLLALHPESVHYFNLLVGSLSALGRRLEAREIANQRLTNQPNDSDALVWLNRLARADGGLADAKEFLAALATSKKADRIQRNNGAWDAFTSGDVGDDVLALAKQAVDEERSNSSAGHTLASILAARGEVKESVIALQKALSLQDNRGDPDFWLIPALVAETLGLPDLASEYYGRVAPIPDTLGMHDSAYDYARSRLEKLKRTPAQSGGTPPAQTAR